VDGTVAGRREDMPRLEETARAAKAAFDTANADEVGQP